MPAYQEHYERLLAPYYTWSFGASFEEKSDSERGLIEKMGITSPGRTIDLGCGTGFQTRALCEMGASEVHSIDTSKTLLNEMKARLHGMPVIPWNIDLMTFGKAIPAPSDTIVCMGDTLTHLTQESDVLRLLETAFAHLREGGDLILSWRDLGLLREAEDRFILVQADANCILTCFLEDWRDRILVTDLLHVRREQGWELQKSSYQKLKISRARLIEQAVQAGFSLSFSEEQAGMQLVRLSKNLSKAHWSR